MSHYTRCKTKLSDHESLIKALHDMGFKNLQFTEEPRHLEGYQGDRREQTAEIVLPRAQVGGASNDLGFKRQEDGTFEAIISDYDRGNGASQKNELTKGIRGYGASWLKKLNQRYSYHKVSKELTEMGYEVGEVVNEGGKIKLHCVDAYGG
jgi:hypothetical protein